MQRARCAHRLPTLGPATPVAWAQPVPSKGEAPSRNEDGAPGLDPCICSVGRTPCSPDVPLGPEHPGRANPVRGAPLREAGKRPLFFAPELAAPPPARTTPTTPAPSACIAKRDMREAERVALPHRAASSSRHLHGPPFDDHREPGGLEGRGRHARVPPDLRQLRRNCLRGRGLFSVPGIRESTSASCVYALAAAVHLAGVAAAAGGASRATRCRSAVAAIHAGGGCRGGRGGPLGGRGALAAMTRQRHYCCTTSRMWQRVAMRSKDQEAGACTRPAHQRGARCKCTAEILSNSRIHRRPRKNSDTTHASPLPCLTGERLGVKSPRSREDRHATQDTLLTRDDPQEAQRKTCCET